MNRLIILFLGVVATAIAKQKNPMLCAVVQLQPHNVEVKNVTGNLRLVQNEVHGPVRIRGTISGLTEGLHGFHVHEKGDLSDGCTSAGPHFNPEMVAHGGPDSEVRHVGDLGNIYADETGNAEVNIVDSVISLRGPHSIVGRAIVVHSDVDDLGKGGHPLSLTTGNSGSRLGCGIIRVVHG